MFEARRSPVVRIQVAARGAGGGDLGDFRCG